MSWNEENSSNIKRIVGYDHSMSKEGSVANWYWDNWLQRYTIVIIMYKKVRQKNNVQESNDAYLSNPNARSFSSFTILQSLPENIWRTIVWWTLHAFMHWMWKIIVQQVLGGEETSVNSNLVLGK